MAQTAVLPPDLGSRPARPTRALVVSAAIGEGHNATGSAIEEAIGRAWPGCDVRWLDTFAAMGHAVGPLARAGYVLQIQRLPWVYEFLFAAIWHPWFLRCTRRVIGSWCGRRLAGPIRRYRPDVIISTYPLASAGLSWLRRHRGLGVPVGAWVSDFCPHPYWVYGNLDATYVVHPRAADVARALAPGASIGVAALPVRDAFRPADRSAARARLGLDSGRPVVLLSMGSLGFGCVHRAVAASLAAHADTQVVVACGRNERLRAGLAARAVPGRRLLVLGWTDDMPGWIAAADAVVTNGGGVTVLEAMACARPVLMFEPIAGHGRANAALMAAAGLTTVCRSPAELTAAIDALARDPASPAAIMPGRTGRRREDDLADLAGPPIPAPPIPAELAGPAAPACLAEPAGRPAAARPREPAGLPLWSVPVRAEDALFLHAQTENVTQQVGAVVLLDGGHVDLAGLRSMAAGAVRQIPQLRRCLLPARSRWARPRWGVPTLIDTEGRISEMTLGAGDGPAALNDLVGRFFSAASEPAVAPWEILLVREGGSPPGRSSAIVVKVHHALGDSYALISALSGLLDPVARTGPAGEETAGEETAGEETAGEEPAGEETAGEEPAGGNPPDGEPGQARPTRARWPSRQHTLLPPGIRPSSLRRACRVATGLYCMARAGRAGRTGLNGPMTGPGRRFAGVRLPARTVAVTARRLGVTSSELVLALAIEALGRLLSARDEPTAGRTLRVMVPRTLRQARRRRRAGSSPENRSAGMLLDLPIGPMALAERITAVRAVSRGRLRRGDADAAAFVLRAMNLLPVPLQRRCARAVYRSRWFNLIISIFPGTRGARQVLGADITGVYPVVALADGVGLAIGAMTWGQSLSIGLIADTVLVPDLDRLAAEIREAFGACVALADR